MHREALTACVESARVLDCEAAYYFPADFDVCAVPLGESRTRPRLTISESEDVVESSVLSPGPRPSPSPSSLKEGHLVVHVRSGDVFRIGKAYDLYGQVGHGKTDRRDSRRRLLVK